MLGALLAQLIFFGPAPQLARAESTPTTPVIQEEPYLVISAVQITGGTGHTQEDFIELYNPTNAPLDLNGYRLVKRTAAGTTDTTVQAWSDAKVVLPHHFFLWVNSNYSAIAATPDATSSATLADNNGIALRYGANDTGEIIDSVAWGSTSNGFHFVSSANPAANESLVRENLLEGDDSFSIVLSNPRNSSVVLELESEPEPPTELPPVENPPIIEDPTPDLPETPDPEEEEVEIDIKITELLPNPLGSDSGFEQIELFNVGEEEVNLLGFRLDDVALTDAISSNAYTLPSTLLAAESYVAVTVPSGKFALNNTSGDVVTLFNPSGEGIDTVFYEDSTPENQSYSYFESGWEWAEPSFGEDNGEPPVEEADNSEADEDDEDEEQSEDLGDYDNSGLEISEIYADPAGTETEFVEINNSGEEIAQLSVVAIWVGEKHKMLPNLELKPGEYFSIAQTALPVQLRNSGQVVKLIEGSTTLSTVTYPLVIDGASFARFEDGFLWTTQVTKDKSNTLKLPEAVKKEATAAAAKTTTAKTTKATTSKATTAKAAAKPATATAQKTTTPTAKAETPGLSIDKPNQSEEQTANSEQKPKDSMGKIIAMGAAAVAAGVIALYKLVFAAGIE